VLERGAPRTHPAEVARTHPAEVAR
jgi:hypothetical protein